MKGIWETDLPTHTHSLAHNCTLQCPTQYLERGPGWCMDDPLRITVPPGDWQTNCSFSPAP